MGERIPPPAPRRQSTSGHATRAEVLERRTRRAATSDPVTATKTCGAHTELVKNDALRLTQCACGTYHLHLAKRGLSVQLAAPELRRLAEAFDVALRVEAALERGKTLGARRPD